LRKVGPRIGGREFPAAIRNISQAGAMIETPNGIPDGMQIKVVLGITVGISASRRWCLDGRAAVAFAESLSLDNAGRITTLADPPGRLTSTSLKTAASG
jgi:hypothetical protein